MAVQTGRSRRQDRDITPKVAKDRPTAPSTPAARSTSTTRANQLEARDQRRDALKQSFFNHLPAWLILLTVLGLMLPETLSFAGRGLVGLVGGVTTSVGQVASGFVSGVGDSINDTANTAAQLTGSTFIFSRGASPESVGMATLFTPTVDYWASDIARWAQDNQVDLNLVATVMQIESCGHPSVTSSSNAQGLFQVMPFHFSSTENMVDPETNSQRGVGYLKTCLGYANGDAGRAMACYNGGPSVLQRDMSTWPAETQRYYRWGTGIYNDAQQLRSDSGTLNDWLNAGGAALCQRATDALS
jgi:hypothetical protein